MKVLPLRKALNGEGIAAAVEFPFDFALEIAFGDAAALPFGNEDAVTAENLGVNWIAVGNLDFPANVFFFVELVDFALVAADAAAIVVLDDEGVAEVSVLGAELGHVDCLGVGGVPF